MSLAVVLSRAQVGIDAPPVAVEVHLANGLPALSIVGLPEAEVKESKDRVRSAIQNAQFEFPARRITVNLAPADLPKEGGRFDLPIAIGILAASGQIPSEELAEYELVGELALTGALRGVRGALSVAIGTGGSRRTLIVPTVNAAEAALARDTPILGAQHLLDVTAHFHRSARLASVAGTPTIGARAHADLSDVRGQRHAKRALEVAAAGGHNLLFIGPPGAGKSMLAQRLPGLLPDMDEREALETAAVQSISSKGFNVETWGQRPFRAPHHTASAVALVGGGSQPRPGEISLAHNGVLFLDELPEFERRTLEVLREPLESGTINISRAARQAEFPARFQLIAAMNPCPCGYLGDASGRCHCTPDQVRLYRGRISGPLLDRIDMQIEVPTLPAQALLEQQPRRGEDSACVRMRVAAARARQLARSNTINHRLGERELERHCQLDANGRALLAQAMTRFGLSARGYQRILKVARTIADLDAAAAIAPSHLSEAIQYRSLERHDRGDGP